MNRLTWSFQQGCLSLICYCFSSSRGQFLSTFLLFENPFWLGQSPSHQPRIPASKSLLFVSQLNSPMVDTCQKSGNSHGFFQTHPPIRLLLVIYTIYIYTPLYIYIYVYIHIYIYPHSRIPMKFQVKYSKLH